MEGLPLELCFKIFGLLDHQNLVNAQQDNNLWSKLFKERWGCDRPESSRSWREVYEVQDRCDRIGLGLKITREGGDYYLVHRGEIQRYLGSRRQRKGVNAGNLSSKREVAGEEGSRGGEPCRGIVDNILFFIGDLEVTTSDAKRARV